jgi:galactarate dehydratase
LLPKYIRVHESDNVGVVVAPEGGPVPQGQKLALRAIGSGEAVVRYGQTIGLATREIDAGRWVREEFLTLPEAPPLDAMELATRVPPPPVPLHGYSFEGFRNPDGSVGTRNLLGLTTTVQCVAPTVEYAAQRIRAELLPHYPNVDGVVAVTHGYGCGVAINAAGAEIPISTLKHISLHANLGARPLVVSLGCEKLQPRRLFSTDLPVLEELSVIRLQDEPGFAASVAAIMRAAEKRLLELNGRRRETCPASDLSVGLQCGGSDSFSGVTCNPAVGFAADLLVRAGASVYFSEVTEVRDAVHLLTPRAANVEVAQALLREMKWYDDYLARGGADRSANPTPGNKRGGLANIVEKALGSIAKAGTTAIQAVASHGAKVTAKGLVFAATPASDFICGTQQLASMNLHVFTTGEGTPYGLAMVPVVKVSSNTALAEKWHDLIDIDAGRIATGGASIKDVGWEIFHFLLEVASGRKKTWAEDWGLGNALVPFTPGPVT